jgi:two-component system sensor histidine kinase VicK
MPEITSAILVTETTINIPEYTIKKKAGTELITDVSFNVFNYDIGKTGYLIVIQDITDRALLEKSRREFIANVSHELRTPLTSIKGATELIIEDDQLPEPMRKRFLSIVMNESDRMTRIVKDLLVLSRLENRRMSWKMSRFSIHSALSQICDALNSEAQDHGHTLTFDSSIPEGEIIAADKERIEQVFTNLIGNSIKYTPNGGKIKVTASMAQEGKYSYKIAVSDNGIGIPEENLPRIFERFYRVDKARNSDVGGTGLGLSISKEIVDAHHGDISITSRKGEGTAFSFTIHRPTPEDLKAAGEA